jgi:hypothetical protein
MLCSDRADGDKRLMSNGRHAFRGSTSPIVADSDLPEAPWLDPDARLSRLHV